MTRVDRRGAVRSIARRSVIVAALGAVTAGVTRTVSGVRAPASSGGAAPGSWRGAVSTPDAGGRSTAAGPQRSPRATPAAAPAVRAADGSLGGGSGSAGAGASSASPALLPRGGRILFPTYRLVGFCGSPGAPSLGRLGIGDLDRRVSESERLGSGYATDGRTVLPVLELIATVVQRYPGSDGMFRVRVDPSVVRTYLAAARRHRALLLLNIQPGRASFLEEVRAFQGWLTEPDVAVALDPEWAIGPGEQPGQVFGHTTGRELDAVAAYLDTIVQAGGLPQKVMVVHQLAPSIVDRFSDVRRHAGIAVVRCVDGIGTPAAKTDTWRRVTADQPAGVHAGFKLFFDEDVAAGGPLMTPAQVLALRPTPEYVMYE